MKTATYLRFSSDMQKESSIEDQLRNVENYCSRMGWPKPRIFKDMALTASRNDRPGYNEMLCAAEAKEFDIFIIDDLSRPWRDSLEQEKNIRIFKFWGIRIIGVSDGIDTDRDSYKIETGLRGMMNELYLDDLAKKTHRGMTGRVLAGYSGGRAPYGYKSVPDDRGFKREIDEELAQWVRYAFTRYTEGASTRTIAFELNAKGVPSPLGGKWSHSTLTPSKGGTNSGILGNVAYTGKVIWNKQKATKNPITNKRNQIERPTEEWIIIDHPELRIISEELWESAQKRFDNAKWKNPSELRKKVGGNTPKYLFSGLIRCGVCGAPYVMKSSVYYGCANTLGKVITGTCSNRNNIRRTVLEKTLLEGIKKELLSEEAYQAFEKETQAFLSTERPSTDPIKARIAKAQAELDNLMAAIKAGIITATTKAAVEAAEQQIASATTELKLAENFKPESMLPNAKEVYRSIVTTLENIENVYQAREALRKITGAITLRPQDKGLVAEFEHGDLLPILSEMHPNGAGWVHFRQAESKVIPLY